MRPPDPRSELFLSAAQVRAQVACPACGAQPGHRCTVAGLSIGRPRTNHAARVAAARRLARDRRLS